MNDMIDSQTEKIKGLEALIHRDGVLENEPWHLHIAEELNCISYDVEAL